MFLRAATAKGGTLRDERGRFTGSDGSPAATHAPTSDFVKQIAGQHPTSLRPVGRVGQTQRHAVSSGKVGGVGVFVKPSLRGFNARSAAAVHQAFHRAADDVGIGHMVLPAAHIPDETKRSEGTFVTQGAPGSKTRSIADLTPQQRTDALPEHDRVGAALLDYLHANRDRHDGNVIVNGRGGAFLIDHDATHGREEVRPRPSVFFQGGSAAYQGEQGKVGDLPTKMASYVRELAGASPPRIAERYGLRLEEASHMQQRAGAVVAHGLTTATRDYGGDPRSW